MKIAPKRETDTHSMNITVEVNMDVTKDGMLDNSLIKFLVSVPAWRYESLIICSSEMDH